ncbi:cinnamoyl-CoA reductase 1-like isoform X4 [Vigna umbellata]|uniref:cinnamoyl-CoA reductase 1-like isoform X3 n=1 Tax=Vigna umbellata TaxID=87088 RepID=UPI001F5F2F48|nr:cinnamoyl-CoA reductase 1-like isoform X3 [Vigna umbellata]XP_047166869.1 cinnamoyl-CoA reductase 1-like isoform X4 [Vigna umbellata]
MAAKMVCVTGAGGFVASWLVQLLLSKGYNVHGTVRQPGSEKYEHLKKLEGAFENLTLFKADLLNYESILSAIAGCTAVFHVASPVPSTVVPNPQVEVIEPAVQGTINVLHACLETKVQRVVYVSSISAISIGPNMPKDKVIDESYWSDKDYCKKTQNWYCYSKTEAEEQALDFGKRTGLDVVSICPSIVWGPILQSTTVNASSLVLPKLLKGGDSFENKTRWIVDVRDLVDAILLVYEKPEAERRYICTAHTIKTRDLVEKLKSIYPSYKYPSNFTELDDYLRFSSEKLERLGWKYRSLEETLIDSVESYREAGLLQFE